MDWIEVRGKVREVVKKYRYALLILALGLVLMWIPEGSETVQEVQEETVAQEPVDTASELEGILGQIDGVGKVKVMLAHATGEELFYQTDDDLSSSSDSVSERRDTVIITDGERTESGLIRQINPPTYLGAIVVCQGADRPSVCLAIVEAVSDVTGLGADRISVLKMK